nr:recombinase family protein [Lysinibacillus timonensis]
MRYGYVRPLYNDKDCSKQLEKLKQSCDQLYQESHGSPKKRIELENMLMNIQKNDEIIVERMFVLADTTRHLIELLKLCERDGVSVQFLNEDLKSNEVLSISLQEMVDKILLFQSDITKQSTTLGIALAKDRGKTIGRPKKSDDNIKKAISMYQSGHFSLHDIKNETGISKSTLYRYLENDDLK